MSVASRKSTFPEILWVWQVESGTCSGSAQTANAATSLAGTWRDTHVPREEAVPPTLCPTDAACPDKFPPSVVRKSRSEGTFVTAGRSGEVIPHVRFRQLRLQFPRGDHPQGGGNERISHLTDAVRAAPLLTHLQSVRTLRTKQPLPSSNFPNTKGERII